MKREDLADVLRGWFEDPDKTARLILRADPTLPALVGLLDLQTFDQCADVVLRVVARRTRAKKEFAVSVNGTDVFLERVDSVDPAHLAAVVTRYTDTSALSAMLSASRVRERHTDIGDSETAGWRV